jgi:hypothetical protein
MPPGGGPAILPEPVLNKPQGRSQVITTRDERVADMSDVVAWTLFRRRDVAS